MVGSLGAASLKGEPERADYSKAIVPALKRGDLLLWDSRALHCNCPGEGAGRLSGEEAGQAAEPELLRATVHMCLSPKSLANEEVLEQRRWAYRENLTLNHQAHHLSRACIGPRLRPVLCLRLHSACCTKL